MTTVLCCPGTCHTLTPSPTTWVISPVWGTPPCLIPPNSQCQRFSFMSRGREASSSSRKLVISPSLSFFMFVDALYSLHMMMGSSKIGPLSSPSSFYPQGVLLGHLAQKNNVNNHLVSAKLFTRTISFILTRTQNTLKYLGNSKRFLDSKTHLRPLLPISQKPGFFVTGNL